ncbi:MAG TPA: circadian clock protein KaiC [Steroidobacteraceae bacterium]|jgi:circadian clock protein KaiC|nr:circadian clock protein KaiC [Steroidobacteraceae bacterium]
MKRERVPEAALGKAPTGITGFDEITGGGLPRGRSTLVVGGAGSGKTMFGLQFLVNGTRQYNEPGIFVAFEETATRIVANTERLNWQLSKLRRNRLLFIDAQPKLDMVQSGDFDLCGLLAGLALEAGKMQARRIVFDSLDMVLALLPDFAARRREVYRLHDWLARRNMTCIFTLKAASGETSVSTDHPYGFMQFMVDCAVLLNHSVVLGVSQRNIRVQKYRGSRFDEDESPFVISEGGFEVAMMRILGKADAKVTNERVSSGIKRLDTMLGGGYYRSASVLITGYPGTAKTTLGGAFAEAACRRGERTMFVSFDSEGTEVVRNLASVGIRLERYIKNGLLRMVSARTITGSAEMCLVQIKGYAQKHKARCLVIDPVSALSNSGNESTAHGVAERLIDWSKARRITLVCTSLLNELHAQVENKTSLHISTLADTWINLNYLVQAGERNRGMSIIKSRGTAHSNQVRELVLSNDGVTLADIFTAGGEVLMGTMRWEKESAERLANEVGEVARKLKLVTLDAQQAELQVRLKAVQTELVAKQVEKTLLARTTASREAVIVGGRARMRQLRGADAPRRKS